MSNLEKALLEIADIVNYHNISIDEPTLLLYSYDASMIRAKPSAVIHIEDIEHISPVIKILYKYSISYTPRLAGTNLSGGATNQKGGVVINLSGCNRIREIDTFRKIAVVDPGVVNIELQNELKKFGYFFAPDPASQKVSTIGGNIAENAGGPKCLKYGVTSNNVVALDVVLCDGGEFHFSIDDYGPQIMSLFCGSEGTLGIIKKAYLKIIPLPKYFITIYAEFKTLQDSMSAVSEIIKKGIIPSALEVVDRTSIEAEGNTNEIKPETEALLITELDSSSYETINKEKDEIINILSLNSAIEIKHSDDQSISEKLWKIRKDAYPSLARIANNILVEDGCVPRTKLVSTVSVIKKILHENNVKAGLVFHAGDGNIHPNIIFDERDLKETNRIRRIAKDILMEYIKAGGTISAEHGVGVEKRGYIPYQHSKETINLMRKIKNSIDEKNISNPYKKIPLIDELKKVKHRQEQISENIKIVISELKKRYERKIPSIIAGNGSFLSEIKTEINPIYTNTMNEILDFDKENITVKVEAGIEIKKLLDFLNSKDLTVPFPQISSTIGSVIARNDFIEIRDNIIAMDIILSDGSLVSFGSKVIKDNSTYDVPKLMIGSRGTLGIIATVTLKLFRKEKNFNFTPPRNISNITPIHIKIKNAFDPENLFNPFLTEKIYGKL